MDPTIIFVFNEMSVIFEGQTNSIVLRINLFQNVDIISVVYVFVVRDPPK